jgi:hypothetical protein
MTNNIDEKTIIDEIDGVLDDLIASYEAMDLETSFSFFSADPDFFMIGSDGLIYDHETFYNANKMFFNECSKFELITYFKDIKVLTNDLVLVSWHYKAIVSRLTGGRDVFDTAGATFLFERTGGRWKVVNYQDSALPFRHESI